MHICANVLVFVLGRQTTPKYYYIVLIITDRYRFGMYIRDFVLGVYLKYRLLYIASGRKCLRRVRGQDLDSKWS